MFNSLGSLLELQRGKLDGTKLVNHCTNGRCLIGDWGVMHTAYVAVRFTYNKSYGMRITVTVVAECPHKDHFTPT